MNEVIVSGNGAIIEQRQLSSDLFSSWLEFLKQLSPKTQETYNRAIKQFLYYLRDNGITQPTKMDIIAYREYLVKNHKPTTVQSYLMAVKQFFKWTADEHLYENIAMNVKAPKLDKGFKKDYLTSKQSGKLVTSIDRTSLKGKRDYAIICLMITTGLRTIEIVRANIEDMRNVSDFLVLYVQGKGHTEKTEYVKVVPEVEDAIREYLTARGNADGDQPLFASIANRNDGERMTTRSVSRIAKEHLIEADLNSSRLTAHSLRHTAATLNLLNGGTTEETMQLLRHANINTTLIYSHALDKAKSKSEGRIAKAIFG